MAERKSPRAHITEDALPDHGLHWVRGLPPPYPGLVCAHKAALSSLEAGTATLAVSLPSCGFLTSS
jgi:hypothetical protein